jgi:hypothetical protein
MNYLQKDGIKKKKKEKDDTCLSASDNHLVELKLQLIYVIPNTIRTSYTRIRSNSNLCSMVLGLKHYYLLTYLRS